MDQSQHGRRVFWGSFFACAALFAAARFLPGWPRGLATLAGVPLLLAYPGHFLNAAWLRRRQPFFTALALAILSSLTLITLLLAALVPGRALALPVLLAALVLANGLGLLAWLLRRRLAPASEDPLIPRWAYTWRELVIVALPLLLFLANYLHRPLLTEGDSYYAAQSLQDSLRIGRDVSPYVDRPGFIPLLAECHVVLAAGNQLLLRFLLPLLFYATLPMALDRLRRRVDAARLPWGLLLILILGVPVTMNEVDIGRAQSFFLALVVPTLLLLADFLEEGEWGALVAAALSAAVLSRLHQLFLLLALTAVVALLAHGLRSFLEAPDRRTWGRRFLRQALVGLVIAFPYLLLLDLPQRADFVVRVWGGVVSRLQHPHWTWWFLGGYSTDGNAVGWPGWQGALYYLYNGLVVLLPMGLFLGLTQRPRVFRWAMLPLGFFVLCLLADAELLPRLGFILYPNRPWPHMMLAVWLLFLLAAEQASFRRPRGRRLFVLAGIGAVALGVAGWLYVGASKGGFISAADLPAQRYLAALPADAVIYTDQDASQVALRTYLPEYRALEISPSLRPAGIADLRQAVADLDRSLEEAPAPQPLTETVTVRRMDGTLVSRSTRLLPPLPEPPADPVPADAPRYFYFSFARLGGIYGSRAWWQGANAAVARPFFAGYAGPDVVFRDAGGVIIKLK